MDSGLGSAAAGVSRATKKVRQWEDESLVGGTVGMEKDLETLVSFKGKLLDGSSGTKERDDFELGDGDVVTKITDGVLDIRFSKRSSLYADS